MEIGHLVARTRTAYPNREHAGRAKISSSLAFSEVSSVEIRQLVACAGMVHLNREHAGGAKPSLSLAISTVYRLESGRTTPPHSTESVSFLVPREHAMQVVIL